MSGHSHFSTIKRKKELTDKKRGQIFSKITRTITIAVKEGGGDPAANSKLRLAIEAAKNANLPKENVERAIKRGTGELAGEKLEEFTFEAFGPQGIAIIIEGITDNKNRALGEIKQILSQNGGKLANEGSVRWLFEKKGVITINPNDQTPATKNKEELELMTIEAGAEDIYWQENLLDIYTKAENLETVKKTLENKGIKVESASLGWVAKEMVDIDKKSREAAEKLFEILDESDSVQDIYSNLKS